MIRNFHQVFVTAAMMLVTGVACAQAKPSSMTIHFDQPGTKINWVLKGTLHTVHGSFQLKGGLIDLNQETGVAEGEIIVETASGESGNKSRDRRMEKEVLESDRYPEAIFHPSKVTGVVREGQTQTITVEGTFTIHGMDHPLFLQVQTELHGDKLMAKTSFVVPYVAWGMKDPSFMMMHAGKVVQVDVDAQASIK